MLIGAIALGLLLGLLAGGNIWNLGSVRLRGIPLLLGAVIVRFATETAIGSGIDLADQLRVPLFALAYAFLLVGLWWNRAHPGLSLAFVGILSNDLVILANGGHMPIWLPSLEAAGLSPDDIRSTFHTILPADLDAGFLLQLGPLADIIPIPVPFLRNVASIGDIFLSAGLAFFLFATVVRSPLEMDEAEMEIVRRRLATVVGGARPPASTLRGETALAAGLSEASLAPPTPLTAGVPAGDGAAALPPVTVPTVRPDIVERARRHPYVRLALNGSFSALFAGQLISLFGDRIHQIALTFLVLGATGSPVAVAGIFIAATLPNLLFGPIAGTFVDRWDHREVMVVSDLLRAALVLLIPVAAVVNLLLVYPIAFLLATVSIFFRPARVAVLPRIVRDDELLAANSALWTCETLADIVGYPLAGIFVWFLGPALPLAFWLDAATYAASAVLLWTIVVPPVARRAADAADAGAGFFGELRQGWHFLRREPTLLANTVQATVAQFTLGILITLTVIYATDAITGTTWEPEAVFGFLETGIGVGNLLGGFAVGLVGARLAKGRMVIAGYAVAGACIALLGVTNQLPIAIALMVGTGIGNMVFVIPSQTLFQERTPQDLLGRVVSFRFAIVSSALLLAMGTGGFLGAVLGAAPVIGLFGLLTLAAGLAGLLVPAVRDA